MGITGNYNASTGVLTLTGTTSLANYQTALRTVRYVNSSDNPSTTQRQVTFVVNDEVTSSLPAVQTVEITASNDPPIWPTSAGTRRHLRADPVPGRE